MATVVERRDWGIGTGRATGGVIGLFVAMALGLGLLAIIAAYAVGVPESSTTTDPAADPADAVGGISAGSIAIFTIVSVPIVALVGGVWAGVATRDAGRGALAAILGTLVGTVLYLLVVGLGIAIGAGAAGVDFADVSVNVPQNLEDQMQFLASVAGVSYLAAMLLIAAVAGAVTGALMRDWGAYVAPSTRTTYTDRDATYERDREVVEEERGPVRV